MTIERNIPPMTAVITGAASGIGFALAKLAAARGMRLVLADIDGDALHRVAEEISLEPNQCSVVAVDVSLSGDVERLAGIAFTCLGHLDLLFNNAGVLLSKACWEYSESDWEWILGVNLWGTIHAIRHFVPKMREQSGQSRIINTASVAGFLAPRGLAAYSASKHAIVAISETLRDELAAENSNLRVSILCPAWVSTNIANSEAMRPTRFDGEKGTLVREQSDWIAQAITAGKLSTADIARIAYEGIENDKFYIFPHKRIRQSIASRLAGVLKSLE
jgi:NAD(P)-dependent dehydrogenase (short-subunit alcohol dehydrogenase family)